MSTKIAPQTEDFLDELAELALGSRLKRLSDRMMRDAGAVYQTLGQDIQPKWFILLELLHRKQAVSVVNASEYLGVSQPAISQFARDLVAKKWVQSTPDDQDSRRKLLSLTKQGTVEVKKLIPIWKAVERAAKQLCEESDHNLFRAILGCEKALERKSFLERTMEFYENA